MAFEHLATGVALLLASLSVAPLQVQARPAAEALAMPAQAAGVTAFVPPGWAIEQQRHADLNRDGRRDVLLLLSRTQDQDKANPASSVASSSEGGSHRSPPRLLAVLLGVRGGYALSALNAHLIPQVDLATQEDPMADGELAAHRGGFDVKLSLMAGVGSYLSASLRYRFRYRDGCFRLIGYDRLETHRATLETRDLSIDFLSGAVVRTTGTAQSDAAQVRREQLSSNPRRCFQELGNAAEFQPL